MSLTPQEILDMDKVAISGSKNTTNQVSNLKTISTSYPDKQESLGEKPDILGTLGSFVKGAATTFAKGPMQLGYGIGKAITAPFEAKRIEQETQTNENMRALLLEQSKRAMEAGDALKARELAQRADEYGQKSATQQEEFGQNIGEARKQAAVGTLKTGAQLLGAEKLGATDVLAGGAFGGGIETGRQILTGEDIDTKKIAEASGSGVGGSLGIKGITRFTNPATEGLISKFGGKMTGAIGTTARSGIGGTANVIEDAILNAIEGEKTTAQDVISSFAMGAGQTAGSELLQGAIKSIKDQLGNRKISELPIEERKNIFSKIKNIATSIGNKVENKTGIGKGTTRRIATSLFVTDPEDLLKSEKNATDFAKMTSKTALRESVEELQNMSKNANKYVDNFVNVKDAQIGRQSLDSVIGELDSKLRQNPKIESIINSDPDIYQGFLNNLKNKLTDGTEEFGSATTLAKQNAIRKEMNQLAQDYYKNAGIVGDSPALKESFLASITALNLKDIIGDAIGEENAKRALNVAHTAMETLPTASKTALGEGKKINTPGFQGNFLKTVATPIGQRTALSTTRSSQKYEPNEKEFYDFLRGNLGNAKKPKFLDVFSKQEETKYTPGNTAGTAFDKRFTKELSEEISPSLMEKIDSSSNKKLKNRLSELLVKEKSGRKLLVKEQKEVDQIKELLKKKDNSKLTSTLDKKNIENIKTEPKSEEVDPLIQEAKKYKSAEEFARSQEQKYPEYLSGHSAPTRGNESASAFDLTSLYPKDIYSDEASRLYGSGFPEADKKALNILNKIKGNPDAEVTIYRAVPLEDKYSSINNGDWITLTKDYASQHGESNLGAKFKILEKKVKADEIFTDANSIQEFGYDARRLSKSQLTNIWNEANKAKNDLLKPFKDTGKKSVTTNIQARYDKAPENRWNSKRGKVSDEIVKRALETKSKPALKRILADFPKAKNPENLTRKEQDNILRALKKQRYS